ncbi:hypothetical protein NWI01_30380 [Nitrobacter winogradskyi]|uniref:Uncharacterized protein n=1 Tax=Nitrobacter winogradskyi TaxID=913 RepID=A0A4Y3WIJ2_NITWI|nr:hypothetical protein NWI01_30380 [Nitrobacter winogradskyi]
MGRLPAEILYALNPLIGLLDPLNIYDPAVLAKYYFNGSNPELPDWSQVTGYATTGEILAAFRILGGQTIIPTTLDTGAPFGLIMTVSQDAIVREKPADRMAGPTPGALSDTSEPQGQELVYAARISLDRTNMRIDDRIVQLAPGMAVTVEIKTGHRRVIEYLLSPLLRYRHDAARER